MAVEKEAGFLQGIVEKTKEFFAQFDIEGWYDYMRSSPLGIAIMSFVGGFAVGFLFKKYFKLLFFCLLVTGGILLFLHYNKIITLDWQAFQNIIGVDAETMKVETVFQASWQWIKQNALVAFFAFVGFLFGYKLG